MILIEPSVRIRMYQATRTRRRPLLSSTVGPAGDHLWGPPAVIHGSLDVRGKRRRTGMVWLRAWGGSRWAGAAAAGLVVGEAFRGVAKAHVTTGPKNANSLALGLVRALPGTGIAPDDALHTRKQRVSAKRLGISVVPQVSSDPYHGFSQPCHPQFSELLSEAPYAIAPFPLVTPDFIYSSHINRSPSPAPSYDRTCEEVSERCILNVNWMQIAFTFSRTNQVQTQPWQQAWFKEASLFSCL